MVMHCISLDNGDTVRPFYQCYTWISLWLIQHFLLTTNHESFYLSAVLPWDWKYCLLKKPEGGILKGIHFTIRDGLKKKKNHSPPPPLRFMSIFVNLKDIFYNLDRKLHSLFLYVNVAYISWDFHFFYRHQDCEKKPITWEAFICQKFVLN